MFWITKGWRFRQFADGQGLVFNPFTGDLYALSEIPVSLIIAFGDTAASCDVLFRRVADTVDLDGEPVGEETVKSHLAALVQLGVVTSVSP